VTAAHPQRRRGHVALEAVAAGRVTTAERQRILDDLREYCGADTLSLAKLIERLRELVQ